MLVNDTSKMDKPKYTSHIVPRSKKKQKTNGYMIILQNKNLQKSPHRISATNFDCLLMHKSFERFSCA